MKAALRGEAVRIAGRTQERELLRRAIGGSVQGTPCAVLVHGEPGVGKTRLVTALTEHARLARHAVLWGRCLRFGAASSPYLPFISAFEGWLAEDHEVGALDVEALYGAAPGADTLPRGVHAIDRALAAIAETTPLVLVVDDLQWADASSLDALAYVIAGMRRRRLAVLVTYRDTGLPDGHPLHSWVADMLRLPGVVDLPLERLSEEATAEQMTYLLGSRPRPLLVEQVWERSGGNPYLTELLVRDLPPDVEELPEDIPAALRSALGAHWHALDPEARRVTQVLAVAGRPIDPGQLVAVLPELDVDAALHRAEAAGVTETAREGRVWFRHPMLADVLYATLLPDETRALHRAFVDVLSAAGPALRGARAQGDLALHFTGAGMVDEAFEACLAGALAAAEASAYPEAVVLMRQASDLWDDVSPEVRERQGTLPALLADTARYARLTGDLEAALEALERARPLLDEVAEPLVAARVHRLWVQIRFQAGLSAHPPLEEMRHAVEVAARAPASDEHALCLADLADGEQWAGRTEAARQHAQQAVEAAERCGDPAALSYALGVLVLTRLGEDDAEELALEAGRLARLAGRVEYVGLAAIALANVLESQGRFSEAADVLGEAAEQCRTVSLRGLLGTYAATFMLPLGRLGEARAVLHDVLASRPRGIEGIQARASALVVAVRVGDLPEAQLHLDRLQELAPGVEHVHGLHGPGALAEYLLAVHRPEEASELLARTIEGHSMSEPRYGDSLLRWAARAAAALPASRRAAALEQAIQARRRCPVPPFDGEDRDPSTRAARALFEAEVARCLGRPDEVERWQCAVALADAAGLRFVAADARLRLAEALLGGRHRREAADPLREAHALAEEMGASPLREEVKTVAAAARVSLEEPQLVTQRNGARSSDGPGLTAREREILGHLVAGRTYADIAQALVISEKTVSVHVSHLLRKTGTASRVEAAAWARRSGAVAD